MRTICPTCGEVTQVTGSAEDMHLLLGVHRWPDGYPCPYCCENLAQLCGEGDGDPFPQRVMTVQQYFQALYNMGLPEEQLCPPEMLLRLLRSGVEAVDMAEGPNGRTVFRSITVREGRTLHFAPSVEGAVVYKVTRGAKDVREVHVGHGSVRPGNDPLPDQDRAQAGPAAEAVTDEGVPAV